VNHRELDETFWYSLSFFAGKGDNNL
jgi:hypothetical protein